MLNLLCRLRIYPKLSVHAQLHGNVNFNRTTLALTGIPVLVYGKPAERITWVLHGANGWYTGPALLEYYQCYTVWLWDTRATRICDTC